MLPIFPLAKNVLSICRQNSPSIESNNNHYTKNILAILARKCAEIRWLQKIAVIWLQIFEGSYFAKTSPRFQNSGELFCHFQDLIFFQGSYFAIQGSYFAGGAILPSRGAILLHRTWRSKWYFKLKLPLGPLSSVQQNSPWQTSSPEFQNSPFGFNVTGAIL